MKRALQDYSGCPKPAPASAEEKQALATKRAPPTAEERVAYEAVVRAITKRPARRQIKPEDAEQTQKVYEGTYNIWFNKWTGQRHKGRFDQGERATTRLNVARDSGYTLADKRRAQNPNHRASFCIMFARGCCHAGHKCPFLHRIPLSLDLEDITKDCFGRDRHRDERDDMNGVGCFSRENKSLYIGNVHTYEGSEGERVVRKHFGAFGDIDRINVINSKMIAFVKYKTRSAAEFAKEAMEHQSLESGEVLSVRWAYDDPNPKAVSDDRVFGEYGADHKNNKKPRTDDSEQPKRALTETPQSNQHYSYFHIEDSLALESAQKTTKAEPQSDSEHKGLEQNPKNVESLLVADYNSDSE